MLNYVSRALNQIKANGLPASLLQLWNRFGTNDVFLAVIFETNQQDEAMLQEYQRNGYTLQIITKSSPPELISKLSELYGLDYFIRSYPLNISVPRRNEFVKARLHDGELCFAILYDGDIAHINWVGFENTWHENKMILAQNLKIDLSTTAYSYNNYAVEQYRGRKLQLLCFFHIFKFLKDHGYQYLYGLIGSRNTASMKICSLVGRFTGVVIGTNYFVFKKYIFLPMEFPYFFKR